MKCSFNRKGSKKRPGKQGYLFTVYDENREVLATIHFEKRNSEAMITVFKTVVEEAGFYPRIISTDKCHIYDVLRKYRKIKHVHAHFETKFIPYNNTVLPLFLELE